MSLQGASALVLPITGSDSGLADLSVFYTAINPTPGTGIIGPVAATFDETKAIFSCFNGGNLVLFPKFLRLRVSVIGTGGTRVNFTQSIDQGNRLSSGGSALTPNNSNMMSASRSSAQLQFGALTTTAASANRRVLHNTTYKATTIETVEDTYQFSWGSATQLEDPCSLSNTAAATANVAFAYAPIAIGPGQSFVLHQWRASIATGITFEVEFGFVEK